MKGKKKLLQYLIKDFIVIISVVRFSQLEFSVNLLLQGRATSNFESYLTFRQNIPFTEISPEDVN
jgi:hypothetical protein